MNYATNKQYTKEEIFKLINNYSDNVSKIADIQKEYTKKLGRPHYWNQGVGNGPDKVIETELGRLRSSDEELRGLTEKVAFIQNRWDRVLKDREYVVFQMRLDGKNLNEIASVYKISRERVRGILLDVAAKLFDEREGGRDE